ncbi:MAG: class I SAM-dependent DNA methyltransferase [Acidobacteria bacterium]|nr:class I SAM-dependent DNA methyltransferase [Acidobacteriota bacterium]
MTVNEFISKWRKSELTERSASQQHFLDLCELFEHPKPAEADPAGEWFMFERGAAKQGGGRGWADVWKRGFFGWEYKGKHKNLDAAHKQLLQYRQALENPRLLVVCDMELIRVHTNFTDTVNETHEIPLDALGEPHNLEVMRAVFHDPERLRPRVTVASVTTEVAERLGRVAQALRARGLEPTDVARFLDRIVFCLFAEDVGLLPSGLFSQIAEESRGPEQFAKYVGLLFDAMREGGDFYFKPIRRFNGNLFTDSPVLVLTEGEIKDVQAAARLDWGAVDASVFGTLFERGLDPAKRSQLGAQYTSRADIETLIEPVVLRPLRREWEDVRREVERLLEEEKQRLSKPILTRRERQARQKSLKESAREPRALLRHFHERLTGLKVLDPACGSGNFLFVTLQRLKDLEKEVLVFASDTGLGVFLVGVGPHQFHGIELNPYAFDLAQTTLWIGYLQWIHANGYGWPNEPILSGMSTFENMDAVLDLADPAHPREPEWPAVDFIVGNPPFLGGKRLRAELGDEYVGNLFKLYKGRVPAEADLVAYWFEKARKHLEEGKCKRAGLLATQGIRGGANREVLKRIKESGDIFFAESDRDWILNGANVHVSMVGFDGGTEQERILDSAAVININSNLTSAADITQAEPLAENSNVAFMGDTKGGAFDISEGAALQMMSAPNPHGKPNSDVIVPWVNGKDITGYPRNLFILDFGLKMSLSE